jgi:uroporphyrin-III C-methyltransferase
MLVGMGRTVSGTIYLVGAGPGDPGLLTLKAARLLAEAGAVLHDRLVSPEILALANPTAEIVDVGKEPGEQEEGQARILFLLEEYAQRYRTVVRLKGGDPFVFGRGAEEWAWLASRGWNVEPVPGVSAALAVPSLAGIPPTLRGVASGFAVITGTGIAGAEQDWSKYVLVDTLIILMAVQRRVQIARALIEAGRDPEEPACFIENGATPRERVVPCDLASIALGRIDVHAPAVLVIGAVTEARAAAGPLRPAISPESSRASIPAGNSSSASRPPRS